MDARRPDAQGRETILGKLLSPEGEGPFPAVLFADLLAAYDRLAAERMVDPRRIAVAGVSYGGYPATLLVAERPVRWLALQAPAIYRDADFARPKRELNLDGELPRYRQLRLTPGDNRALAAAARFTGDVLIVEAEHDAVIPHRVIDNYLHAFRHSAASVTYRLIAGADHGLTAERWRRAHGAVLARWLDDRRIETGAADNPAHAEPIRRPPPTRKTGVQVLDPLA